MSAAPETVYQISCEPDSGFSLDDAGSWKPWSGWRVKYRPLSSRGRWTRFLTDDDLSNFGVAELQRICSLHAARLLEPDQVVR